MGGIGQPEESWRIDLQPPDAGVTKRFYQAFGTQALTDFQQIA